MALETWLIKVKKTISNTLDTATSSNHNSNVGVLSFEMAHLMSKLLHIWKCLSDKNIIRLRDESISLQGVRKIVSNDESFLLGLACAEMAENLRLLEKSISRISKRSNDPNLQCFDRWFDKFANSGHDSHGRVLSSKDMEAKMKMD
ncbi:putative aminotransferase ACS12-like [Hibiscus syriacus]|uniref:Aminotransferase ACS12-like n=1 Tax=Hibiscus syriacus TaxID=106335 RepID=A0A6A2XRT8_HIBSY|nr:putative aminotransferase ACS12-like [Hibiscus syriacus]